MIQSRKGGIILVESERFCGPKECLPRRHGMVKGESEQRGDPDFIA